MTLQQLKHIIQFDSTDQLREALDNQSIDFDINQYETSTREIHHETQSREKEGKIEVSYGLIHYAIDRGDQSILDILCQQPNIDLNLNYIYNHDVTIINFPFSGNGMWSKEPHDLNEYTRLTPVEYAFRSNKNDMAALLIQKGSNFSADKVKLDQLVNVFQRLSEQASNNTQNEIKHSLANVLTQLYSQNVSERNHSVTATTSSQTTSAATLAQSYSQSISGRETSMEEGDNKRPRTSFS